MGKHVLVTGGNGHVGFNLVQHLVGEGYQVRTTVRDTKDPLKVAHLAPLGVELVQADLLRAETSATESSDTANHRRSARHRTSRGSVSRGIRGRGRRRRRRRARRAGSELTISWPWRSGSTLRGRDTG